MAYLVPRCQWIELHDLDSCPQFFRHWFTGCLAEFWRFSRFYLAPVDQLADLLKRTGHTSIIDLCSGSSGPSPLVQRALAKRGLSVKMMLTDLVPDVQAYQRIAKKYDTISYAEDSVDATACKLPGMRTIFAAFHHFPPPLARAILQNAIDTDSPIAIFEATERSPFNLMFSFLAGFWMCLLTAPFAHPFSFWKLLFTYMVPILPLSMGIDSFVSCMRTYHPEEMREMVNSLKGSERFRWEMGRKRVWFNPNLVYYIGYPLNGK